MHSGMNLYPLKFHPIYKERIWGGSKLKEVLGKQPPNNHTGESWEISAVPGNESVIANGALQGALLPELIAIYRERLLGERVFKQFGNTFPLLIKFIDAREDLSIQLHPNDELAQERHQCAGKTEMWYVMQADRRAQLIVGFNQNVTQASYEQHLIRNTLPEILQYEPVTGGDAFFIKPGLVHAIGAGILLAEIQQTSDITYRLYDYNRKDKDGKLRELHTDLAKDAIDYQKGGNCKLFYDRAKNISNPLATCPYFTVRYLSVTGIWEHYLEEDSFTIYIGVEGSATIITAAGTETLKRGETLLVPAAMKKLEFRAEKAAFLEVFV